MNFARSFTWLMILPTLILLAGCSDSKQESGGGGAENSDRSLSSSMAAATKGNNRTEEGLKILRLPIHSDGPGSLDPADGSTQYDNRCLSQIYETLLQYKYLKRPLELEPLLLEEMPQVSEDGKTYQFKLKKGVRFHDDACFPDGKGAN